MWSWPGRKRLSPFGRALATDATASRSPLRLFSPPITSVGTEIEERAFAQYGPGVEDREVVRRGVNDQLVPFPCAWHQQWHRPSKRSRCTISIIASDSFSGPTEIVRGWTPTSHGVFTDNLDRTRRQLATNFESKSASLAAGAEWTDSIGGHWHLKILFDAAETEARSDTHSRTIWIFSDMMNQTPDFDIVRMLNLPRNVCWSEQR